ncbi:DUF6965 family protein [Flavobacterium saccharophilum]|uniref:DUF6965 domain-containing protein n=1 Tax=Flavobacterium saccharophilum TaxID=29534 RepID=A0A1M7FQX4_9FLAO|nr:hypothetical protein [Flavobacterium saccharophilum]SHM06168.1 hypothetical protein SAMN05444366_2217 [Flavobacterium saccharophilum]
MTPEEIKRYFEATPPPKEVDWKPWAKITDSQVFLKSCYSTINNYKGSLDMCPAWWHLKDFYLLVRRSPQENKSENQPE